jgi:hypothetical protein
VNFEEMENDAYMRQLGIVRPQELPPLTIIGAGSAGSGIAVVAGKLGVRVMDIWDHDVVSTHNIANQYFRGDSIGLSKVEVLKEEVERLSPIGMMPIVNIHNKAFEEGDIVNSPIVMMCVDGFDNRRNVMATLMSADSHVDWVIDSRMSGEYYELRTVKIDNADEVADFYKSLEGEAREEPCTARSVIYAIMAMSSRAMLYVKKIAKGEPVPMIYSEHLGLDVMPVYRKWRSGEDIKTRLEASSVGVAQVE